MGSFKKQPSDFFWKESSSFDQFAPAVQCKKSQEVGVLWCKEAQCVAELGLKMLDAHHIVSNTSITRSGSLSCIDDAYTMLANDVSFPVWNIVPKTCCMDGVYAHIWCAPIEFTCFSKAAILPIGKRSSMINSPNWMRLCSWHLILFYQLTSSVINSANVSYSHMMRSHLGKDPCSKQAAHLMDLFH